MVITSTIFTITECFEGRYILTRMINYYKLSKQFKIMDNSTTWHETGHAVFASIFKDYLEIKMVTILHGEYGIGANLISTKKAVENTQDYFHLVIVNLAGIVVDYLKDKRTDVKAMYSLVKYITNRLKPEVAIVDSFDGDLKNMQEPLDILSKKLNRTKEKIVCSALVYFANCLFRCEEFWPAIDAVATQLEKLKTLTTIEIDTILNQIGFNQFLIDNRIAFYNESIRLMVEDD